MSMSCFRIRSSSRSSGPSYTLLTETAKGESLSSFLDPFWPEALAVFAAALCSPTTPGETEPGDRSAPLTIFVSSIICIRLPTWRFLPLQAHTRATFPSPPAHRASSQPPPSAPVPCQPPEYPRPAADSPHISCASPAWDSGVSPARRRPSPCTQCSQSPPTGSLRSLCPWLRGR